MHTRTSQPRHEPSTRKRNTWPPPSPQAASEAEALARRPVWRPAPWTRLPVVCLCVLAWLLQGFSAPASAQEEPIGAGTLQFRTPSGESSEAPRQYAR